MPTVSSTSKHTRQSEAITVVTIFGLPAIEVEQPSGEIVKYLAVEADLQPHESRAWSVTQELGTSYRVSLLRNGNYLCSCKDFFFRFRRCRARKSGEGCKHVTAILSMLAERRTDPLAALDARPVEAPTDGRTDTVIEDQRGCATAGLHREDAAAND